MKSLLLATFLAASTCYAAAQQCGHNSESWAKTLSQAKPVVKPRSIMGTDGIRYIPLTIHFVRHTDGSFSTNKSVEPLYHTLMMTNKVLNPIKIQFYVDGTIDYINNDKYLNAGQGSADNLEMKANYKNANSANLYIVDGWAGSPASGYAGPGSIELAGLGVEIATHEIGHFLTLAHTFDTGNGIELVTRNGGNCATAGDQICDTEADPYGLTIGQVQGETVQHSNCVMTSNTRDTQGTLYTPPFNNYMSYYGGFCGFVFTQGQYDRMNSGYTQYHTGYQPLTGAGIATAPTNLAVVHKVGYDALTWTNASGAVATSFELSSDNGVTWNVMNQALLSVTEVPLAKLQSGTSYKFRARHLNSIAYSNVVTYSPTLAHVDVPISLYNGEDAPGVGSVVAANGSINNTTNLNNNFSLISNNSTPELIIGGKIPLQLKVKTNGNSAPGYIYFAVWLDENGDGDFSDNGELKFKQPTGRDMFWTLDTTITISGTAKEGFTRMRIRGLPQPNSFDPLIAYNFSEVEDYVVKLVADKAPTGLTAVYNNSTKKVDLQWQDDTSSFNYDVERSADGVTFTKVFTTTSGTSKSYSDDQLLPNQQYAYRIKRQNGALASNEASAFVPNGTISYCVPPTGGNDCSSTGSTGNDWYGINTFSIPSLTFENNSSAGCGITSPGYSDYFDSKTINVQAGQTYNFNIGGQNGAIGWVAIYADFNQNGLYDSNEELFKNTVLNISSGSIAVPSNAMNGVNRLRVRGYYNNIGGGCASASFGETEDYKIVVTGGKESAVVDAKVLNVSTNTVQLSWAKQSGASPTGFTINKSTDGVQYTPVTTVANTASSYTVSGLTAGQKYFFQIIANGTQASEARVVWATTNVPSQVLEGSVLKFKAFPNPFTAAISIQSQKEIETIRLFDLMGKEVYTRGNLFATTTILYLGNIAKGVYQLQVVYSDGDKSTQKIIKQ